MPLKLSPTQAAFNARGDGTFNKPFAEQVEFLRQKLDLPTEHYDDILKSAHDRAFMVAGAAKADLLADLHGAINQVAAEGKSIQWFRKNFFGIVQKHGWEGWTGSDTKAGRDWRTRVIYSTNLSASYAAGRYAQLTHPDLLKSRPYWKYVHSDTVQTPRPLHQQWSKAGLTLKWDDPFWKTHFPPNGWGCQCRIVPVSADKYTGQQAPDDGTYEKVDRNGEVHTVPKGVDYGWDYTPGASVKEQLQQFIAAKAKALPEPLAGALKKEIVELSNSLTKEKSESTLLPDVNQLVEGKKMNNLTESEKSSLRFVGNKGFSPKPKKEDLKTLAEKGLVEAVPGTGSMTGLTSYELTEKGKILQTELKKEHLKIIQNPIDQVKLIEKEKNPIAEKLEKIGGKEWVSGEKHRVYFDDPISMTGSDFGSKNKNYKANSGKLYFDVKSKEWNYDGASEFKNIIIKNAKSKIGFSPIN